MRRRDAPCPREPIGLSREEAAAFIGVSVWLFEKAVENGRMPAPFELFGRVIWDADEIAKALRRLPRRGGQGQDDEASDKWGDVAA